MQSILHMYMGILNDDHTMRHLPLQTTTVHLRWRWSRSGNRKAWKLAYNNLMIEPERLMILSWTLGKMEVSKLQPSESNNSCWDSWEPSWATQLVSRVSKPTASDRRQKRKRKNDGGRGERELRGERIPIAASSIDGHRMRAANSHTQAIPDHLLSILFFFPFFTLQQPVIIIFLPSFFFSLFFYNFENMIAEISFTLWRRYLTTQLSYFLGSSESSYSPLLVSTFVLMLNASFYFYFYFLPVCRTRTTTVASWPTRR